jgi:glycerophosphoryl diester phosphodiesterase
MLVFAHRGYSGKYPENTLLAFKKALEVGASAIELDVHLSKDRQLVVTHDYKLGRCVKGTGCVSDYTAKELSLMDAGSFKDPEFANEQVPTLVEVLDLVKHQCLLNIEIKKETLLKKKDYTDMVDALLKNLEDYGLEKIIFSSFNARVLKLLREKSPEAKIAFLNHYPELSLKIKAATAMQATAYNLSLQKAKIKQIQKLKASGFKVNAYTCKDLGSLELAKSLGLDGIFADNLEEAIGFFH